MSHEEQLLALQEAQGDPAKLAFAAVDIAYHSWSVQERAVMKETLSASAVPHWCDEAILSFLLDLSVEQSAVRLSQLRALGLIEQFGARGLSAVSVHESARLPLRQVLFREEPERFRVISTRVATYFELDVSPLGRIERVYHLLLGDPSRGAAECAMLREQWTVDIDGEHRFAMALALEELLKTNMLDGPAKVEALLWTIEQADMLGHREDLDVRVREALDISRQSGYESGETRVGLLVNQLQLRSANDSVGD